MPKSKVKKTGLGRGIGSLLGENTRVDVFSPEQKPLKVEFQESQSEAPKALKEDFIETKTSSTSSLSTPGESVPESARIWTIAVEKVVPNPKQPRREFEPGPLNELAASIKEKGILQPIVCRKITENRFEIVAGERRWRASQIAGLHHVPVIIKEYSNQEVMELALIENIQREDLNPMEEAEAYNYLVQEYGLTQQSLAEKVGKDRATVANIMRLVNLGPEVKRMVSKKEISLGQAKVLLGLQDLKLQKQIALRVFKEKLSVRALEKLVKVALRPKKAQVVGHIEDLKFIENLREQMQKIMGTKVGIDYNKGKGKLTLSFYSTEELNEITDRIKRSWNQ